MRTIHMQDSDVGSMERRGWRPALPFEQGTMPETEGRRARPLDVLLVVPLDSACTLIFKEKAGKGAHQVAAADQSV